MAHHSTVYTNKDLPKLLQENGISPDNFNLAKMTGKPSKSKKGTVEIDGRQVKVFGPDFIAIGSLKEIT